MTVCVLYLITFMRILRLHLVYIRLACVALKFDSLFFAREKTKRFRNYNHYHNNNITVRPCHIKSNEYNASSTQTYSIQPKWILLVYCVKLLSIPSHAYNKVFVIVLSLSIVFRLVFFCVSIFQLP